MHKECVLNEWSLSKIYCKKISSLRQNYLDSG